MWNSHSLFYNLSRISTQKLWNFSTRHIQGPAVKKSNLLFLLGPGFCMNSSYRSTLEWIFVKKSKGLCSLDGVPEYWFVSSFLDPERLLLEQSNNWSALGFGFSFRIVPKQPTFVFLGFSSCCGFFFFKDNETVLFVCGCTSAPCLLQE